jgi:DnaJ-domain-containing protein 1
MRALQQRWQEHARTLPLERKSEQALWQRFRAVCDGVFQRRKESMHEADIERRAHEAAKEAISARLEAAAPEVTAATAGKLLREAAAEWQAIGPVPRAHEARVEKRYHAAVAQVQHHADLAKRAAGLAQAGQLRDKLRLVQELEQAVAVTAAVNAADEAPPGTDWEGRWSALPPLDAELERTLRGRFEAAQRALNEQGKGREAYAQLLERNRDKLLHELLRAEIRAGIDSGPEFARERLKLQVEVLQSSLKSGQRGGQGGGGGQGAGNAGGAASAQLRELCALPALVDARTASRIEQLFMRLAREGK